MVTKKSLLQKIGAVFRLSYFNLSSIEIEDKYFGWPSSLPKAQFSWPVFGQWFNAYCLFCWYYILYATYSIPCSKDLIPKIDASIWFLCRKIFTWAINTTPCKKKCTRIGIRGQIISSFPKGTKMEKVNNQYVQVVVAQIVHFIEKW